MDLFFKRKNELLLKKIYEQARVKRYIQFIIGCFLVAAAYNLFLASNDLVVGGVGGIAIILNHLFGSNNSLVIFIGSAILLIMSYFLLGKEKTKATILGSILFPIFVNLTENIGQYINIDTSELLLSSIFCGIVYGTGVGMVLKAGFTSGGTDVLEQIFSKYFHISMGTAIIIVDGFIVLSAIPVFGINNVMYAILILYLISFMSDRVILGTSENKAFYIVTEEDEKVKEYILESLGHGVTEFNAKGGYSKKKQEVLMCVLPTKSYYKLKEGLKEIDKDAFFIVTDAYEVFGGEI